MWAAVARHFDIRPEPEEYIESVEPNEVVVRGWYRGTARSTGRNLEGRVCAYLGNARRSGSKPVADHRYSQVGGLPLSAIARSVRNVRLDQETDG